MSFTTINLFFFVLYIENPWGEMEKGDDGEWQPGEGM